MYPKTFAALAIAFWALAIGVLIYTAEETAPRAPLFGFTAIAGAMFGLGWLIVFLHDRDPVRQEAAPVAAPETPEPEIGGEITIAFRKLSRRIPSPRVYMADPCPPELSAYETVEMVPASDVTDKIVRAYGIGDTNGYDRAVADMAGIKLNGDGHQN